MNPLEMLKNKEENLILYEDAVAFAVLEKEGAAEGHVKIYPKKSVRYVEELSDEESSHIIFISSYVATAVFEAVGAQGTNIIVNNGVDDKHLEIDVLPRSEDDNIDMQWTPSQAKPEDLESVQKRLKQHTDYIGLQVMDENLPAPEQPEEEEENDYRIKQLERSA